MLQKVSFAWMICRSIIIVGLSGLVGATLIRLAPGFGMDERLLDARLSGQSIRALENEHQDQQNSVVFYARFLGGLLHGDAGQSAVFGQPVRDLIRNRAPTTLRSVTVGLAIGWTFAVLFAVTSALTRRVGAFLAALAVSGTLLSIPSAVLATVCLLLRLSPAVAIAAVILPRVIPYAYEQLRNAMAAPHVVAARARGLTGSRIFLFHVVPATLMPLLALAGVTVTLAFGASIPVEALADSPGLGQLAWRAALGRDMPVLVSITLLLTVITVFINVVTDVVLRQLARHPA
jgi:peptide/nickel transport system permease protein